MAILLKETKKAANDNTAADWGTRADAYQRGRQEGYTKAECTSAGSAPGLVESHVSGYMDGIVQRNYADQTER